MGYKRTVHCSYCGEAGHNKLGCPAWTERIEQYRADFGDDHYMVSNFDEKKKRMANAKNNRSCSYCGKPGHSRAGCSKLKDVKEQFRTKNVEYRENFLKVLIDNGIGPGAMIKYKNYSGETIAMIKDIDWKMVNMAQKSQSVIRFCDIKQLRYIGDERWLSDTRLSGEMTGTPHGPVWEVVVPTSSSAILEDCPKDFIGGKKVKGKLIAGKLGMKEVFKNKELNLYTMKDYWGDFDKEFNIDDFDTELR